MAATVTVHEGASSLTYEYRELVKYHGFGAVGGVAHAFKVLERGLPLLDAGAPIERRDLHLRTSFGGPGARDGFEMVTRCVSDSRYTVTDELRRPERGEILERYVFELTYQGNRVTLMLCDGGFVRREFIMLSRKSVRSGSEEEHLAVLKREMAQRLLGRPADEVYELVGGGS